MKPEMLSWVWRALYGNWREVLATALIVFSAWVAAQIYLYFVGRIIKRSDGVTFPRLNVRIWRAVRMPGAILIVLIGVYGAMHRYQFRTLPFLDSVLFVLSVTTVLYAAVATSTVALEWYGEKVSRDKEGETVARELLPLTEKVIKIVVIGVGLTLILDHFQVPIQSILISFGVGSLAVGLALQDTLANMVGGFTIMLDRPFRIGDRIQLQSGEQGDVRSIGMRATKLMMPNGHLLVIPNSYLVKSMVINQSNPDTRCLVTLDVAIAGDSDTEQVKRLMLEAACSNPRVLQNPAPSALVKTFASNALTISLNCFVRSYNDSGAATDQINSAVMAKFQQSGIRMAFPERVIHVVQESSAGKS